MYSLSIATLFLVTALAGCVQSDGTPSDTPGGVGPAAELEQDKGGIEGVVVDDSLSPVGGVQIALLSVDPPAESRTDETGAFRIVNVEPGKHELVVQKLGYESAAKVVTVEADQMAQVQVTLMPIAVAEPRTEYLIGEGYFACGAYILGVLTWGNLHACVWDNHQPRYVFEADRDELMGVMQEIVWEQTSALTAEKLITSLQYKPVCDPFCEAEESWEGKNDPSPVRSYIELDKWAPKAEEDPIPLASMTFPGGDGPELVIVFQQRITHYITIFYGVHGDLDTYTGIPDA
jgi:hypothetical protein